MARRIKGLPDHWEHFLSCLLMHVAAPFLPLALEKFFTDSVEDKSLFLFVAMYAMAIGITSSSRLIYSLTLLVGVAFSALYGSVAKGHALPASTSGVAFVVLGAIVLVHCMERFNRHVVDRAPFWEFDKKTQNGAEASGVGTTQVSGFQSDQEATN